MAFKMKGTYFYGKSPFKDPTGRRDDIGTGLKSGGGFFKRLKKEGVGSAVLNTAPVRYLRSVKNVFRDETKRAFSKAKGK